MKIMYISVYKNHVYLLYYLNTDCKFSDNKKKPVLTNNFLKILMFDLLFLFIYFFVNPKIGF